MRTEPHLIHTAILYLLRTVFATIRRYFPGPGAIFPGRTAVSPAEKRCKMAGAPKPHGHTDIRDGLVGALQQFRRLFQSVSAVSEKPMEPARRAGFRLSKKVSTARIFAVRPGPFCGLQSVKGFQLPRHMA